VNDGFGGFGSGPEGTSITISKGDAKGFGMTLVGPVDVDDSRIGVYVSKIKPGSPASQHQALQVGARLISVHSMDVQNYPRKDVVEIIKGAGTTLNVVFAMDEAGIEQQYGIVNNSKPSTHPYAGTVIEVELAFTGGTGVLFAAPMVEVDAHKGVYVTGCADLSSAYASQKIRTGQKILNINGTSLNGLHGRRVHELINTPKNNRVTLHVQYDPTGFAVWDNGKELANAKRAGVQHTQRASAPGPDASRHSQLGSAFSACWWFGANSKEAMNALLLGSTPGTFAVRMAPGQRMKVVLSINDNGGTANFLIALSPDGSCTFAGALMTDLDAVIATVTAKPMMSKFGGQPYVATAPASGGLEFNFYEFSTGTAQTPRLQGGGDSRGGRVAQASAADIKQAKKAAQAAEKARKAAAKTKKKSIRLEKKASKSKLAKMKGGAEKGDDVIDEEKEEEWKCPSYPVERIAIAKRDADAFGMTFVGPLKVEDKRTGIYISKIKEGGAAHNTEVKVGMKILAMNGQPMVLALKSEASGSLKDEETAIMTLQFDPQGFGSYDGGVLLEEIKQADLAKKAEEDAKDPLAQGDDL